MKEFLICIKRTKWQRDIEEYGSAKILRHLYRLQNNIFRRVYASHVRQERSLEKLRLELKDRADFIYREDLSVSKVNQYHTLVSFGGDNHFIYVARFAGERSIIGVNSDPLTSSGALVYFNTDSFLAFTNQKSRNFERWTMIVGEITFPDGQVIITSPCISETSIHNTFSDSMSRYFLRINQEPFEEQKSSGLLLATGAGSTGWFHSCLPETIQIYENPIFGKNQPIFKFVAREPGHQKQKFYRYLYKTLSTSDTLEVISEMDGQITIDSHPEISYSFPAGAKASFRLSDTVIKVIIPN